MRRLGRVAWWLASGAWLGLGLFGVSVALLERGLGGGWWSLGLLALGSFGAAVVGRSPLWGAFVFGALVAALAPASWALLVTVWAAGLVLSSMARLARAGWRRIHGSPVAAVR